MEWYEDGWSAGPVMFDRNIGLGNIPDVMEIGFRGAVLAMRPSVYLSLAAALEHERSTYPGLRDLISGGRPIAMPMLKVEDRGDGTYLVTGHEGRHRMRAIQDLVGDAEVPIALMVPFRRARHMNTDFLAAISAGLVNQDETAFVPGPLFGRAYLSGQVVDIPETVPAPGLR